MQVNVSFSSRSLRGPLCAPVLLLALACGGENRGRSAGDSDQLSKDAPPQGCDAEALLPLAETRDLLTDEQKARLGLRVLLPGGDFEGSADGWSSSTDGSPKPPSAARPIKSTCPRDSKFDCCLYSQFDDRWRKYEETLRLKKLAEGSLTPAEQEQVAQELADNQLTPAELAQVETEKLAQKAYNCALLPDPVPADYFFSGLGSSLSTQLVEKPSVCAKDKKYWVGTGFFGLGSCQAMASAPPMASPCDPTQPSGDALHVRGARLTDWGAQIYQSFSPPKDASEFDGVSFWVKLGKGGSGAQPVGQTLFIVFDDKFTKENQDTCYDVSVDTMKCDRFGAGVGLGPEWRFVKIPFDSMRQRGYGVKSPAGRLLKEELLAFGIYMDIGNWDFWIDQIAFYKEDPPVE